MSEELNLVESKLSKKQLTRLQIEFALTLSAVSINDISKELLEKAVRNNSDLATWKTYIAVLKRHNKIDDVSAIYKRALIYLKEPGRVKRQVADEWLAYLRSHSQDILKPKAFLI